MTLVLSPGAHSTQMVDRPPAEKVPSLQRSHRCSSPAVLTSRSPDLQLNQDRGADLFVFGH